MLRVLRATAARSRRAGGASFFARYTKTFDSTFQSSHLTLLRSLSSSQSSRQGRNGSRGSSSNNISRAQDTLRSHKFSDDCESSKSAEEDNILTAPEIEDVDVDEDEAELVAESGEDSSNAELDEDSDFDMSNVPEIEDVDEDEDEAELVAESGEDSSNAELDEDSDIDMSNVPEELKEMIEDGYEIESVEEEFSYEGTSELLTIDEVKQVLEDVRARDVQIFSVEDRCEWTDLMVVATGNSDRHVRGIADALVYKIKKKVNIDSPLYPTIEGQAGGKWLVVDCGNIVIHVLDEDSRAYYRLEDLWTGDMKPSTTDEDLEKMLNQAGLKDIVP